MVQDFRPSFTLGQINSPRGSDLTNADSQFKHGISNTITELMVNCE